MTDQETLKRALAKHLDYADESPRVRKFVAAMLAKGIDPDQIDGLVKAVTEEPDKPERDPEGAAWLKSLRGERYRSVYETSRSSE